MQVLFIETQTFSRRRANLLDEEAMRALEAYLLEQPEAGAIIKGTGGCRKIRWQRQGTGKSGGIRVIYYYLQHKDRIYFLLAYAKNEADNLTNEQKNQLKQIIDKLE